ncbi:MAG: 6-carboxytetrahydropterin synthase [Acidobacteriota bacterium]|nr:6-carboxytetrahydropterin synthase [Acidobacteriota bacterium]
MKVHLTRRYLFSASHRLHQLALSDAQNRAVYGKCNNPHGHGHNYFLEVTVSGPLDPVTGMVCDLGELDAAVRRLVLDPFDHTNLNLLPVFSAAVPTTENLTLEIARRLHRAGLPAHLEGVRIEETANNSFEFHPAAHTAPPLGGRPGEEQP